MRTAHFPPVTLHAFLCKIPIWGPLGINLLPNFFPFGDNAQVEYSNYQLLINRNVEKGQGPQHSSFGLRRLKSIRSSNVWIYVRFQSEVYVDGHKCHHGHEHHGDLGLSLISARCIFFTLNDCLYTCIFNRKKFDIQALSYFVFYEINTWSGLYIQGKKIYCTYSTPNYSIKFQNAKAF